MNPWLCVGVLVGLISLPLHAISDKDGDGVPDFKDACPGTPVGSRVGANGCIIPVSAPAPVCLMTSQMNPYPSTCHQGEILSIYFDFGSAFVPFEAAAKLAWLAKSIEADPVSLLLQGHTDDIGTDAANYRLSAERADNVAATLAMDFAFPKARITTASFGESMPVAPNNSEIGRQQNRRVDILILVE
ncbi:OmpA family protein [Shewanella sp. FJAT-52076]|uniref:OmpA family protein n=1 Tax=Shewanella sp. FJAT-52076 TaxID=2864202 RepID=UPI001C660309|nr:OmpA family protein [Shewanella sp. FJAT-52076]QYJ74265.1 OmpA family protein [Shewanella sp. FJAT-52076]